jgi:hypothetical protein
LEALHGRNIHCVLRVIDFMANELAEARSCSTQDRRLRAAIGRTQNVCVQPCKSGPPRIDDGVFFGVCAAMVDHID